VHEKIRSQVTMHPNNIPHLEAREAVVNIDGLRAGYDLVYSLNYY
jgi:hypothetical protein